MCVHFAGLACGHGIADRRLYFLVYALFFTPKGIHCMQLRGESRNPLILPTLCTLLHGRYAPMNGVRLQVVIMMFVRFCYESTDKCGA